MVLMRATMPLTAAAMQHAPLRVADALVPGLLVGGIVARIGCVFTGCCRGITMSLFGADWFRPLTVFALYDIAAMALVLFAIRSAYVSRPGARCVLYLIGYGALRFIIEFDRPFERFFGVLTYGHVMAGIQLLAGGALLIVSRRGALLHSADS